MSDFSLMDAIECGIVKLPRVPVAENIPGDEMPVYRNLWEHIRKDMPKKGRGAGGDLDPLKLPNKLQTALEALYGHYQRTFELWQKRGISVPPCFIVVCQNTAISKLVYDYVSGFYQKDEQGRGEAGAGSPGALPQLRRHDRQPARAAEHAADRLRGARVGRCAGPQVPRDGGRRDRALPSGDHRADGRRTRRREHYRSGPAARGDEHGWKEGPARCGRSGASCRCRCSPRAGTPTTSRTSSASAPSARSSSANR